MNKFYSLKSFSLKIHHSIAYLYHFCIMEQGKKMHIAIFASGAGSNASNLIKYFKGSQKIEISLIISNNAKAGVLAIAKENNIPSVLIEKERFFKGDNYLPVLREYSIDNIVLAGFLWKVPAALIQAYPERIINIHPALLPKYGGKGMFGSHVHEAIVANKEKETGITIHIVDEIYDNGRTLFQAKCAVLDDDTPEDVAHHVHQLEYTYFPQQVEKWIISNE